MKIRTIKNRKGKVFTVKMDAGDVKLFDSISWFVQTKEYYGTHVVYFRNDFPCMSFHREVVSAPREMYVIFKNGDTLDCRKENLQLVTKSQLLQARRRAAKSSATKIRGVWWNKQCQRWEANVNVLDKRYVKRFEKQKDAREWAQMKRRQLGFRERPEAKQ